jgi:hypothetical protein
MTAGAFDVPIHTKNISTRDFAVRAEHDAPAPRRERAVHPPLCGAAALLVACMTVWHALQDSPAHGVRVAACVHFYVSGLVPMLLYDHILAPARSRHMWALLAVHVGVMLFAHPLDRAFVSVRLHLLLLALCVGLAYGQAHARHTWQNALAACASLNSALSVYLLAQHPDAAALYYHGSFMLLFTAVVLLLYAH